MYSLRRLASFVCSSLAISKRVRKIRDLSASFPRGPESLGVHRQRATNSANGFESSTSSSSLRLFDRGSSSDDSTLNSGSRREEMMCLCVRFEAVWEATRRKGDNNVDRGGAGSSASVTFSSSSRYMSDRWYAKLLGTLISVGLFSD